MGFLNVYYAIQLNEKTYSDGCAQPRVQQLTSILAHPKSKPEHRGKDIEE
jgi:hypothetical protein